MNIINNTYYCNMLRLVYNKEININYFEDDITEVYSRLLLDFLNENRKAIVMEALHLFKNKKAIDGYWDIAAIEFEYWEYHIKVREGGEKNFLLIHRKNFEDYEDYEFCREIHDTIVKF